MRTVGGGHGATGFSGKGGERGKARRKGGESGKARSKENGERRNVIGWIL